MFSRLFGPRLTIHARILGLADGRMCCFEGDLRLRAPATVGQALAAAGKAAGADLLAALTQGTQPVLMLDDRRIDPVKDLDLPLSDGARVAWLLPVTGG